ncbi:unnamed protein product, partial [Meganyctiphanes norvegica]
MGVNEYSDLTYEEVIDSLTGDIRDLTGDISDLMGANETDVTGGLRFAETWYTPKDVGKEPKFMDYVKEGAVNPIRHQGACGSCWAFSAIASIESQIFIQKGKLIQLSEQYLVDCSKGVGFPNEPGRTGCEGGWKNNAIRYVSNNGIAYSANYPYTAKGGTCNQGAQKTLYRIKGMQRVRPGKDSEQMNALVHRGPIAVSMFISENFHEYKKGIFEDNKCQGAARTHHAMALVGYGEENGKKYWLIRNSWGESWGWNGYMKLCREINNHCLISIRPYIPVLEVPCSGGVIIGGQCLVFSQEALNWGQAKTACENRDQTLASLINPKAVLDYVKATYGNETFLLGGSDAAKEGE